MPDRKIELTWVCSSCRHRNLGRDKACVACGNPKDASEKFEMPGDTRAAASVSDPALLRAASAGADWRCPFCRADNRALDTRCKQCGAERGATPANVVSGRAPRIAPATGLAPPRSGPPTGYVLLALVPVVLAATCLAGAGLFLVSTRSPRAPYVPPQPSFVVAHVVSRSWSTARVAMRHTLVAQEGFAEQEPADAIEVVQDGVRHHHDDQVENGTEEQTYTEEVPYEDTETYTEMVPCGQDCTTIPPTCNEVCTDDGNGFASCHDECTGGGQTCTPRTCPETRTRPVTRTRTEIRTRTVPHFDTVPRDAPWFHWRARAWVEDRRAEHHGDVEAPSWPSDEELGAGVPLADGDEERIDAEASFSVALQDARGGAETFVPDSLEALAAYPVGAAVEIELDPYGSFVRVVGPATDAHDAD